MGYFLTLEVKVFVRPPNYQIKATLTNQVSYTLAHNCILCRSHLCRSLQAVRVVIFTLLARNIVQELTRRAEETAFTIQVSPNCAVADPMVGGGVC